MSRHREGGFFVKSIWSNQSDANWWISPLRQGILKIPLLPPKTNMEPLDKEKTATNHQTFRFHVSFFVYLMGFQLVLIFLGSWILTCRALGQGHEDRLKEILQHPGCWGRACIGCRLENSEMKIMKGYDGRRNWMKGLNIEYDWRNSMMTKYPLHSPLISLDRRTKWRMAPETVPAMPCVPNAGASGGAFQDPCWSLHRYSGIQLKKAHSYFIQFCLTWFLCQ